MDCFLERKVTNVQSIRGLVVDLMLFVRAVYLRRTGCETDRFQIKRDESR